MRVLVTGSSGRVGGAVAERLARDCEVVGLDLLAGTNTQVLGDIRDHELVAKLTKGLDAIVHLASLHAPHVGVRSEEEFHEVNLLGTERLLEAARSSGVRRFVYTSTTSLYGAAMESDDRAVWVTEALEPEPRDVYDRTKIAAEQAVEAASVGSMTGVSLRMSRCFPERDDLMALYRLYRGVDVRDVAEAHALALSAMLTGFEVFNISAASPFRVSDLEPLKTDPGRVIERYHPGTLDEFRRRGWPSPVSIDRVYVIDRAQRELGYNPRFGLESVLKVS